MKRPVDLDFGDADGNDDQQHVGRRARTSPDLFLEPLPTASGSCSNWGCGQANSEQNTNAFQTSTESCAFVGARRAAPQKWEDTDVANAQIAKELTEMSLKDRETLFEGMSV